jgi:HYDIN/CFA65/VesB family protein/ASPM-SPD-2-Hydin domain-containing protein
MARTARSTSLRSKRPFEVAGVLLVLGGLALLVGCQGVSAGPSSSQQSGTLSLAVANLDFGNVTSGSSKALTVTATNSGSASITVSSAAVSTKYFAITAPNLPVTIAPGQGTPVKVQFTPNAAGNFSATLTLTSNASDSSASITLKGMGMTTITPGQLALSPTAADFGTVTVGNSEPISESVTNIGGSSVDISQIAISGTGFTMSGISAPLTLAAGQNATFTVTFTPTASGSAAGNIAITSDGSNPNLSLPLTGTGTLAVAQLSVTPTTLAAGSVVVGTSGTVSGSLSASGANVTISAAGTNNSAFSIGGISLPMTVPAGQSIPFTITFSPTSAGAASGTLTFTSNAQPSTTTASLTGTGTPAPTHDVSLSWDPSSSPGITGYNIYRSVYTSSCGSFSKINTSLDTGTLYTDSVVVDGTSYCYATTAVNTSNEESGYSNIVSNVQIPAP